MIISLVVSAVTFGCATYLAIELATMLNVKAGRVSKASAETMTLMRALLPIASGMLGAMLASYNADWKTFVILGLVCAALAMSTWSETCFSFVPDFVVLVPLTVLLIEACVSREWGQVAASLMLAIPFGVLAVLSKGKGVARTDIELAALGGALLGFKFGVIAFVVALLAAFFINYSKRGQQMQVELTPYLSSAIVVAVLVRLVLPTDMV